MICRHQVVQYTIDGNHFNPIGETVAAKEKTVLMRLDLPESIHKRLRAEAALNGVKAKELVNHLLDKHLPRFGKSSR